ncbi:helix-turn-helix transcriptional regulator [Macrococcoides caseolyticum]|uniref:helix-turn-helix domain-containing protein n=1 Tax=Macrococcoides caseolyticum TaxID=69966 RepID=UPI0030EB6FC4
MLNQIIKMRREEIGMSRKKLCDNLCSESTLYRFENGLHDINSHLLFELCKRLKLETITITDIHLTEKEHSLFLLMQHFIYKRNINELENILMLLENNSMNNDLFKISKWCEAVILFYKKDYNACQHIIENTISIQNPNTIIDLLILNTLISVYILQQKYADALDIATNCFNYINTRKIKSFDIVSKIKYSYAYSLYMMNYKNESKDVILDLVTLLMQEKTFFLLGKSYYFLYLLYKDENLTLANKYLKLSYMAFIIENNHIPKQVIKQVKSLNDISIFL